MNIQTTVLASGLPVITVGMPGLRTAAVGAFVKAGARDEDEHNSGLAHFLEHMAFKGTTKRNSHQIAAEAEVHGSEINAYTDYCETAYHVRGMREALPAAVSIIGDVLTDSLFAPDEIEVERGVILQEIAGASDDAASVTYDAFGRAAFPGQSVGRPILGSEDFVQDAKPADFKRFIATHYVADNMAVVGAGEIDHAGFVEQVAEAFEGLPGGRGAGARDKARYVGGIAVNRDADFGQINLMIGFQSVGEIDPRYHAHRVMAAVIGDGMSSPLFQEVREKRGLAYSVGAGSMHFGDYGYFYMHAGTGPETLDELIKVSAHEFLRATRTITPADFARAKAMFTVRIATAMESPLATAIQVANSRLVHGEARSLEAMMQAYQDVTVEQVMHAASGVFLTNPSIAIVGPVPDRDYLAMVQSEMDGLQNG